MPNSGVSYIYHHDQVQNPDDNIDLMGKNTNISYV